METGDKIAIGLAALAFWVRFGGQRPQRPQSSRCEYSTYAWDTERGRSTDHEDVNKPFSAVTGDEVSSTDPRCTICESDQVLVELDGVPPFEICWVYVDEVVDAFLEAQRNGFIFEEVEGYRPGRTGGRTDSRGVRTEYGEHAYGLALDINGDFNGMYRCRVDPSDPERVRACRLAHGGEYRPERYPRRSIVRGGPLYRALTRRGWVWAGDEYEELGYLDIMHFRRTHE